MIWFVVPDFASRPITSFSLGRRADAAAWDTEARAFSRTPNQTTLPYLRFPASSNEPGLNRVLVGQVDGPPEPTAAGEYLLLCFDEDDVLVDTIKVVPESMLDGHTGVSVAVAVSVAR